MDRGRDLVDVLATRTLGADRMQFDLGIGDSDVVGYFQHLRRNGVCFPGSPGRGL